MENHGTVAPRLALAYGIARGVGVGHIVDVCAPSVTLGDGAVVTGGSHVDIAGSVTLGNDAVLTGAQETAVGGNVTVGTNSVVTLGSDAMVNLNLTMGDGTTLALSLDNSKLEADPDFKPIGGTIKLTSGEATVKVSGDFSDVDSEIITAVLGSLDPATDVKRLNLDATGVTFVPGRTYRSKLKDEDGRLLFYAYRPRLFITFR